MRTVISTGCAVVPGTATITHTDSPWASSGARAILGSCREQPVVIVVRDEELAQQALAEGSLRCPHRGCGDSVYRDGYARRRMVRTRAGGERELRPQRVACRRCGRTNVLLPAWCVPGRSDDAETIGSALLAAAQGQGHRPIAAKLDRPATTVRGWLRAARGHVETLRARAYTLMRAAAASRLRAGGCGGGAGGRGGGGGQALPRRRPIPHHAMGVHRPDHGWPLAASAAPGYRPTPEGRHWDTSVPRWTTPRTFRRHPPQPRSPIGHPTWSPSTQRPHRERRHRLQDQ